MRDVVQGGLAASPCEVNPMLTQSYAALVLANHIGTG
jgi:hypothetical protein